MNKLEEMAHKYVICYGNIQMLRNQELIKRRKEDFVEGANQIAVLFIKHWCELPQLNAENMMKDFMRHMVADKPPVDYGDLEDPTTNKDTAARNMLNVLDLILMDIDSDPSARAHFDSRIILMAQAARDTYKKLIS